MFRIRRSWGRILGIFYWSSLELFLWGVLTMYLNRVGASDINFLAIILGALIFWNFLIRIQHGITISFLEDIWTRNLLNLFASPLSLREYLGGILLTSMFEMVLALSFMSLLAWALFAYNILQVGLLIIPFAAILFVFGFALGISTTALILRLGPSAEILAWSIPALLFPLSSVVYPLSALPPPLQYIASILPTTYAFEGMRSAAIEGSFDFGRLVIAFALSLIFLLLSYAFLKKVYRYVLRRGLFTRFATD